MKRLPLKLSNNFTLDLVIIKSLTYLQGIVNKKIPNIFKLLNDYQKLADPKSCHNELNGIQRHPYFRQKISHTLAPQSGTPN